MLVASLGRVCTHQGRDYWTLSTFWLAFEAVVVRSTLSLWSRGLGERRIGGRIWGTRWGTRLYSPALSLLNVIDFLGFFEALVVKLMRG